MRFLIIASIFACAAANPAGPVAPLVPTQPSISAGDINGAAIEAQVAASDQYTAAADADRKLNDKVSELQGQAINNAEEKAWREVDAVKTIEAKLDGATASAASAIAKDIVRSQGIAPVAPIAPAAPIASAGSVSYPAYVAPNAPIAPVSYPNPPASFVYNNAPVAYDAPFAYDPSLSYPDASFAYPDASFAYPDAPFAYSDALNYAAY